MLSHFKCFHWQHNTVMDNRLWVEGPELVDTSQNAIIMGHVKSKTSQGRKVHHLDIHCQLWTICGNMQHVTTVSLLIGGSHQKQKSQCKEKNQQ